MRLRTLFTAAACGVALAGCSGGTASTSGGLSPTVVIRGFAFAPATLHVSAGATVTWTNDDTTTHTTTADRTGSQPWDSGNLTPGSSYAVIFTRPGTYSYHCDIHNYMTATIVVGA